MPNPDQLRQTNLKRDSTRPKGQSTSEKTYLYKTALDVDEIIRALPEAERVTWLRRVICDAAHTELSPSN